MSIVRFEIIATVFELGSFTAAAEKLNMTQSAVSHAVAGLESEWDVSLFIRDRRKGITLTEVGQKVLPHIREVLKRMESIHQEIALATNLETGIIRIGTFASASSCLLPKLLAKFQKKHPKIEFKFYEGTYEEITEWLSSGVIDIGFVVKGEANPNFDFVPLIKDDMVVAYHPAHRFQSEDTVDMAELAKESFIMPTGMYQSHVEALFEEAQIKPSIRFEVHDCTTIANMVQEGLGVTVGPELFLKTQQNIKVSNLTIRNSREVALACQSIAEASPAVKEFLHIAKGVSY
ncbi:LysR family transcriptional regulator [Oceanobacillus oncorhynchi subsp. incaldanensis]|uniref:HTH-type transcriptional activator CmpR n=2 Tax=Oceanobacillus TaxID=182709 RepID=A0A0A1MW35_9BACI|nr:LysR family transcriptional regulator [Oceanobacillus oncorhynchi]MDM8101505.1 LysR family transcriptional regulator [Oceanobacillus oncorhynchi]UUI38012.1 LysR family transcriptional regulator [Oceanobacillus oncorhynchi]GIO17300.1 LysR family transcriptional regulator [Oceanobacillus oncorhynchi subsp. incaldanensis]CEI83652.1 HTH-type transcriptional activator CmpR [Oceanobacillus oncorhynchi]